MGTAATKPESADCVVQEINASVQCENSTIVQAASQTTPEATSTSVGDTEKGKPIKSNNVKSPKKSSRIWSDSLEEIMQELHEHLTVLNAQANSQSVNVARAVKFVAASTAFTTPENKER